MQQVLNDEEIPSEVREYIDEVYTDAVENGETDELKIMLSET